MFEKRFAAVPPQLFIANGTTDGVITLPVAVCTLFKVKQKVIIAAAGQQDLTLEIKQIDSDGHIEVGPYSSAAQPATPSTPSKPPVQSSLQLRTDISAYTLIAGAIIFANEQPRPRIDYAEIMRAVYDEEPTLALRTSLVDELGDRYSDTNPLPVNADVTVNSVQLFTLPYDTISASYPTAVQEVYKSYLGGLSGTLQQTVTVNYVDATKNQITTVLRTPIG